MCSTALFVGLLAGSASAADASSNGEAILPRARSAWDRGDWRQAEALYKHALDAGGLSPNGALDAYVRLGTAAALLKKRDAALVAYRHAALLQPRFTVPRLAGRRGAQLANLARKQEAKIGVFHLGAEVPENVAPGLPLQVAATLDADHAAILARVAVLASDTGHGEGAAQTFRDTQPSNTNVRFTLPGTLLTAGATITVRIDALDVHDNRMASVERLVHVAGETAIAGLTPIVPGVPGRTDSSARPPLTAKSGVQAPEVLLADVRPLRAKEADSDGGSKGGGFWHTAWPYVISGVALAAGGAVAYFATRPGDDVTVGAARIDAR
jgi:hypothetical protein